MSGRAGRRGIDDVGKVMIACWEEVPPVRYLFFSYLIIIIIIIIII